MLPLAHQDDSWVHHSPSFWDNSSKMQARTCCSVRGFSRPLGLAGSALSSLATVIDRMSRLRRPFLDDRYLFATVNLLSNLEERYFGRLAISLVRMRQELGSLPIHSVT
jgi:hypothetical protein